MDALSNKLNALKDKRLSESKSSPKSLKFCSVGKIDLKSFSSSNKPRKDNIDHDNLKDAITQLNKKFSELE